MARTILQQQAGRPSDDPGGPCAQCNRREYWLLDEVVVSRPLYLVLPRHFVARFPSEEAALAYARWEYPGVEVTVERPIPPIDNNVARGV